MTYAEARQLIKNTIGGIVRFTLTASASADGHDDAAEGRGTDDEAPKHTIRRLWPFGIRSLPPEGVDCLVLHANGGSTNGVMVGAESKAYGPPDLRTGETMIYCIKTGTRVFLDESGAIKIDAAEAQDITLATSGGGNVNITVVGAGNVAVAAESGDVSVSAGGAVTLDATGDVTVNGGTFKVARVGAGDKVESHTHTATHTLVAPSGGGSCTGDITIVEKAPLEITIGGATKFKA